MEGCEKLVELTVLLCKKAAEEIMMDLRLREVLAFACKSKSAFRFCYLFHALQLLRILDMVHHSFLVGFSRRILMSLDTISVRVSFRHSTDVHVGILTESISLSSALRW